MTSTEPGIEGQPAAMTAALVTALVDPLLDARTQPAGDRFDEVLTAALAARTISTELGRELRFWQRASVHELADHVRTVLPAVLPVAIAAAALSAAEAACAADSATQTWTRRTSAAADVPPPAVARPAAALAEAVVSAPDEITVADPDDAPDDAVAPTPDETNPHVRRRMFVAGLTSSA